MGAGYSGRLNLHLDGDNVTQLNALITVNSLYLQNSYKISNADVCRTTSKEDHYFIAPDGYIYCYFSDVKLFVIYLTTDKNFFPLVNRSLDVGTSGKSTAQLIYKYTTFDSELSDIQEWWDVDRADELYQDEPSVCTIITPNGTTVDYKPERQQIFRFMKDRVAFNIIYTSLPDHHASDMTNDNTQIHIRVPNINQISDYYSTDNTNMPAGLRAVVFSDMPQYSVNSTYRGRQSYNIASVRPLLQAIAKEVNENVVDLTFANKYNIRPTLGMRIDLGDRDPDKMVMYTKGRKDAPLYATLRFPPEMLLLTHITPASRGGNDFGYDEDEFESAIIPNAGAIASIGGGILAGVGQGLSTWAQNKQQMEMQARYLDWAEDKQQRQFMFNRSMQGDMFQFQKETQIRNIGMQSDLQHQQFEQQNAYQQRQNEFTKNLVETNLDSDIRRARNAQQLAGYRTDATVSNLSMGAGRGGFGHPLAPQGAPLPPRSASTQTYSPRVNLTQPSGYYSGPLESVA